MEKVVKVIGVIVLVILVIALNLGWNVLVGALLVWLASKAFVSVEFSWALAAFVGVAILVLSGIFGVTVKNNRKD